MDVMSAILGLLDHQQTTPEENCKILSLVSQILHMSRKPGLRAHTHGSSVLPFSRREQPVDVQLSAMAASALPRLLARADDSSDDVRESAMDTLGDLIPFIEPDSTCEQRTCGAEEEENLATFAAIDNSRSVHSLEIYKKFT